MTRPATLVVVTGTGTGVGKTWWAAQLARRLRTEGCAVAARKPVQSGPDEPSDADVLAAATGVGADEVCAPHRRYERAWAPPMAADDAGAPRFTVAELVAELSWPPGTAFGLVEGAGGPRSPLAADGDTVDLARALRPDGVVLVADAGLGTINAVRLSVAALGEFRVVVALNRFGSDPLHTRNQAFLAGCGYDVVTSVPELVERVVALRP
jgi:dethiobiotin synthetase